MKTSSANNAEFAIKTAMANADSVELLGTNERAQGMINMQTIEICLKAIEIGLKICEIWM